MLADALDLGERRGRSAPGSHVFGSQMRQMVDEPQSVAGEIRRRASRDTYRDMRSRRRPAASRRRSTCSASRSARPRLPYVELDEEELAAILGALLERHGLLQGIPDVSTLRVLPLGGLGEIGKNMTVVEYEDRIVVVDTGLRFPTRRDARGSTSRSRTSPTCASAPSDIEAIVITHGHEDHLGALPWVLRSSATTARRCPSTAAA